MFEILECWKIIQEGNPDETLQIENPKAHPSNVVLATAPTGNLNAQAIQGDDGSMGILFEVDLQIWSTLIARSIEGLLVTETDESFQIRHPKDPDALVAKEAELGSLCEIFAGTAIHGTVMAVQDRYTHPAGPTQEKKLTELLNKGFLTFVAGHKAWRA